MRTALLVLALILATSACDMPKSASQRKALNEGAALYKAGQYAAAARKLESYVAKNPKDDLAWTILGNAYERDNKLTKALSAYQQALKINPKNFQALTGTGIVYRGQKKYKEALTAYQQALKINPKYGEAYTSMAVIALKAKRDKEALVWALKGYDLRPQNPTCAANLAVCYHYNGDFKNRDKFTAKAKALGYKNVEVLNKVYSGKLSLR